MVEPTEKHVKKIFLKWDNFDFDMKELAQKVSDSKVHFDYITGMPRGGLPIAVALSHLLKLPYLQLHQAMDEYKAGKRILLCDDVIDTGETLEAYSTMGNNIFLLAWTQKPQSVVKPDFVEVIFENNIWIVFPWETP